MAKGKMIDPPEHEHSAGCWPGGEREFECDVMQAFESMRAALREILREVAEAGHKASVRHIIATGKPALALAAKVKP